MGVRVTVQVGQTVTEVVEGPYTVKTLVSANYPTQQITTTKIVVYEQGEPIYRTVLPETWQVCHKSASGAETKTDVFKVVPVKTDTASGLTKVAADNRDLNDYKLLDSKKVATGLAFKDFAFSDANAIEAAKLGEQLSDGIHHLDQLDKYYRLGNYNQDKVIATEGYLRDAKGNYVIDKQTGFYIVDATGKNKTGTIYGSDVVDYKAQLDKTKIRQDATELVQTIGGYKVEAKYRAPSDQASSDAAGLLTSPGTKVAELKSLVPDLSSQDLGINKYPKDTAVVSGYFTAVKTVGVKDEEPVTVRHKEGNGITDVTREPATAIVKNPDLLPVIKPPESDTGGSSPH